MRGRRSSLVVALVALLAAGCASLPQEVERLRTQALKDPGETTLGRLVAAAQPDPERSGFRLVPSGARAYAARLALIERAERTLDLQYYSVERDALTRALFVAIRAGAERGVRVRLLVDDLSAVQIHDGLARFASHPNVEVRLFNPLPQGWTNPVARYLLAAADLSRITRRMHNKLFIADNALAITGGRNLGAAYFRTESDRSFVDLDVLVGGPAVQRLSRVFDWYWNSELSYPGSTAVKRSAHEAHDAPPALPDSAAVDAPFDVTGARLVWAPARVLNDWAIKVESDGRPAERTMIFDDVLATLRRAERAVTIVSPYVIPGDELTGVLRQLTARGVHVRVLTNSLASTDVPAVHGAYARHRDELLGLGIELHELRALPGQRSGFLGSSGSSSRSTLHAKAIVIDGHVLFVGSMNLDPRSAYQNTEIGVLIDSAELGAELLRVADQAMSPENSYEVRVTERGTIEWVARGSDGPERFTHDPDAGFWKRTAARFLGLAIPPGLL
jgi:cardiolipin synthase C